MTVTEDEKVGVRVFVDAVVVVVIVVVVVLLLLLRLLLLPSCFLRLMRVSFHMINLKGT